MIYDLVFEGGGAKGMAFVGALQEFAAQGHTCGRLLGTSAGAITAAFMAIEYTPEEMLRALNEKENGKPAFTSFMGTPAEFTDAEIANSATLALFRSIDIPFVPNAFGVEEKADYWLARTLMGSGIFRNLFCLVERGGWYSADNFVVWMKRKLDEGQFQGRPRRFSDMTMKQLYEATGRELSLVTSDTSAGRLLVLNHHTAPDLPVVWAVRMSMSIPLIWPEVVWEEEWGLYLGKNIAGHYLVDGGLLSNFPIELFISDDLYITEMMGDKLSDAVLGLLVDELKMVAGAPAPPAAGGGLEWDQLRLAQRINRFINTAIGAHDKMVLEAFEKLVVRLPAQGYGLVEFEMSDARREALIAAGRDEMKRYLAQRAAEREALEELGMAYALGVDETYEIDVAKHADKAAKNILDW